MEAMIGVSVIDVSVLRRGIEKYEEISDRNWTLKSEIGPIEEEKILRVACLFFTSLVLCFSFFLSFSRSLSLFVCVFRGVCLRCVKFLLRKTN